VLDGGIQLLDLLLDELGDVLVEVGRGAASEGLLGQAPGDDLDADPGPAVVDGDVADRHLARNQGQTTRLHQPRGRPKPPEIPGRFRQHLTPTLTGLLNAGETPLAHSHGTIF
jgi:hypothetical protein